MSRLFIVVLTTLFVATGSAAEPNEKAIKAGLARMLPNTSLDALKLRPSLLPGLFEAEVDTTVFYVTADGKHILYGDLIDTANRTNLTDERRQAIAAKVLEAIPEKNMIVMGPKDAKRTITVFTDPDCGYCRRLQDDVPELIKHGVRVRYLLYPRTPPGTESYQKSIAVWCAPDRAKAMAAAMGGKSIDMTSCANPVDELHALAERLNVNGTPAIFMDDGKRVPGYVAPARLLPMLGLAPTQTTPR